MQRGIQQEVIGFFGARASICRDASRLLLLLISADALFIALHLLHMSTGFPSDPNFSITKDRGFAEIFQYVKEYWIIVILAWLFLRRFQFLYLAWSLLFGYVLLDDSFKGHEKLGAKLAHSFERSSVLGGYAQHIGELVVFAVVGFLLLGLIGVAYRYSSKDLQRFCRRLVSFLAVLVFFGVAADIIHSLSDHPVWNIAFGTLEDGGEMVIMSALCWYMFTRLGEEAVL